jgi:hypothetical protein
VGSLHLSLLLRGHDCDLHLFARAASYSAWLVCRFPVVFRVALVGILSPVAARPQANISADEIPIECCGVLPVVKLRIDSTDMRFLRGY